MKNKILPAFLLSLFLHGIVLIKVDSKFFAKKNVYSKNIGEASIKLQLSAVKNLLKPEPQKSTKKSLKQKQVKEKSQTSSQANKEVDKVTKGQDIMLAKYLAEVRAAIARNKYKSPMAKRMKMTGSVKLEFSIFSPNSIRGIKIVKPAKFQQLNDSAVETLNMASEIPAIPTDLAMNEISLSLIITYE